MIICITYEYESLVAKMLHAEIACEIFAYSMLYGAKFNLQLLNKAFDIFNPINLMPFKFQRNKNTLHSHPENQSIDTI